MQPARADTPIRHFPLPHASTNFSERSWTPVDVGTTWSLDLEGRLSLFPPLVLRSSSDRGATRGSFLMTIFAQLIGFGSIPTARYGMTMSLA